MKQYLCSVLFLCASLVGQRVLIIGASSGIGKQLALICAEHDYQVAITARRLSLLHEIQKQFPHNIIVQQMDICNCASAQEKCNQLIQQLGGLDVCIICAADFNSDFDWKKNAAQIQTNVMGFCAVAHTALQHFFAQNSGHLVGISSIDALRGAALCPLYCATKAFMSTYLEGMRNRCIQNNIPITITDILPGYVSDAPTNHMWWVASMRDASEQIFKAIQEKQHVAYITHRWKLAAWLIKYLPDPLYNAIGGI